MGTGPVTYSAAAADAAGKLETAGVPEAKENALLLLEYVCNTKRQDIYLNPGRPLSADETGHFEKLVKARAERVPLQQLTGSVCFMGLDFIVDENVLIPRQDTEILVERVLKDGAEGKRLLDMCTGSGCIPVSLAVLADVEAAAACDISAAALSVARRNAAEHKAEITFYEGDMFGELPAEMKGSFDIITSNPPYIRSGEIAELMPEVRDHEPVCALDGGTDGLIFYRRIAAEGRSWLKEKGRIYMEIGYDQANDVSEIFAAEGYKDIETVKDLAGLDRVVIVRS